MRLLCMSDLHLEFDKTVTQFVSTLESDGIDVLILAGDIYPLSSWIPSITAYGRFCEKFPQVIVCAGNHCFYGGTWADTLDSMKELSKIYNNLHFLENDIVTIDKQRFIVGTGWYPDQAGNETLQWHMNDIRQIGNFNPYPANTYFRSLLEKELNDTDIVVTHHLVSPTSIHDKFKGNALNRFFLNDIQDIIEAKQPKLVIHGHSHESADYFIGTTRVVNNSRGYSGYHLNTSFNPKLIIEV